MQTPNTTTALLTTTTSTKTPMQSKRPPSKSWRLVSFLLMLVVVCLATKQVDCGKNKGGEDIIMMKGKLIMRGGKEGGNLILDTKSHDDSSGHSSQIIPVPVYLPHYEHHQPQMHHQPMMMQPIYLEDHSASSHHHHEPEYHHEPEQHHHSEEHHSEEHHSEPEHHHQHQEYHHGEPYHHEGSKQQLQRVMAQHQLTPQQQQQLILEQYQHQMAMANNMAPAFHQPGANGWQSMMGSGTVMHPMQASVMGFNPIWMGQASQLWPQVARPWQKLRK